MSIFHSLSVACPKCAEVAAHDTVYSVNADRRPDLRVEITEESFQRARCPSCGAEFRLDPEFVFVDAGARQWIAAYPLAKLSRWKELEGQAQGLFDRVYGEDASDVLRDQGRSFARRVTFGWASLREKLVVADRGLDDVAVELCKAAILRSAAQAPIDGRVDLRLLDADDERLSFGWLLSDNEQVIEALDLARPMYEEVASDAGDDWADLRSDLTAGLYVDLNRLMLA
jgi:hypothetical protein